MLFSSTVFIFYFLPIVILLYYAFFFSRTIQNYLLLLVSLFFYSWGEPNYVFIMIGVILFDYSMGLLLAAFDGRGVKKLLLFIACIGNLSTLFFYKYFTFILRNLNDLVQPNETWTLPSIMLPIGISFFTFQGLSYVIDVYREKVSVEKNPFSLGLYISFFPQLIAGPIVRYSTISDQIKGRKETWQKCSEGCCRFIIGLAKKVLLSNVMAIVVDHIFELQQMGPISVLLAWLGAISYMFQIYYDFSGYSDMAIGLSLMFGFKFEENFNYPYCAISMSDFWRRWHISLGQWFKDYVYFPLGGSKVENKDHMVRNLFIVWLLTGIWHGAEWTFVLWGLFNFVAICCEKIVCFDSLKLKPFIKHSYVLCFVLMGLVLFRSPDLVSAGNYFSNLFGIQSNGFYSSSVGMFLKENAIFYVAAILFTMPVARRTNEYVIKQRKLYWVLELSYPIVLFVLFTISVSYLVKGTYNPFIYFNF